MESLRACVEAKGGDGEFNLGQVADKIKGDMKGANDFKNDIQQKAWFDDEEAFARLSMAEGEKDKSDEEQDQNVDVLAAIQNSDFTAIGGNSSQQDPNSLGTVQQPNTDDLFAFSGTNP